MPHPFRARKRWPLLACLGIFALASVLLAPAARAVEPVQLKDPSAINAGDTAWMLVSAGLVLMMTGPALALFYGGLVRRKNVLATMMQSFILMAVVSVLWVIVGYSLAFDVGNPFIGGLRFAFLRDVDMRPAEYAATIPHTTFMVYQLMFAVITPALICGAYAERMKFKAMLLFSSLWLLVVYCPMAHMVWGKGGLFNAFMPAPGGPNFPALDFAGGTVVHVSSGVSALICALVLGRREGYGDTPMPPHSVVLSVIGAALLWVGWFGFNGGSALSAGGLASNAFTATHLAAAGAALGWMFAEWLKHGKPTVLGAISGAVAGLVVITPASGFTTPMWGLLMGVIGGVVCFFAATSVKAIFGYDDSLDAFGVHGVGGTVGAILTGVFAIAAVNTKPGLIDGNPRQVVDQLIATGITWVFAGVGAFVLLKITQAILGLRVSEEEERLGLDLTQHGEAGYFFEDALAGTVTHDGHGSAVNAAHAAMFEPRSASVPPPPGGKRFSVVVEGVNSDELINAWSNLCRSDQQPRDDFRAIYPHFTTVQGNRFRFRDGDPATIRESLAHLFQTCLGNSSIEARTES